MYVMILFALVLTGEPAKPMMPVTRPDIGYYLNEDLCEADMKNQLKVFASGLPDNTFIATKCVKISGPVIIGEPA